MKKYTCRYCGEIFEAREEDKGITWYERAKGWYYHLSCWEEYVDMQNEKNSEQWLDLIFDLITRELKQEYNYFQIKSQCKKMVEEGMTMKGIYLTVYYTFLIQKNKYEKKYGIGLVRLKYEEAGDYWVEQMEKEHSILEQIEEFLIEKHSEGRLVKKKQKKKNKMIVEEPEI